ncbi:hypothetical protein PanWU01x14_191940, partial [Parasponia andersonii]
MPTCFQDPSSVVPLFLTAIETLPFFHVESVPSFLQTQYNAENMGKFLTNVHLDEYRDSFFNSYTRKNHVYLKCLCSSENILYPAFYLKQLNLATGRIYRSKSKGGKGKRKIE